MSHPSDELSLAAADPFPGLIAGVHVEPAALRERLLAGEVLAPLLPLGGDAAFLWIPGNGSTLLRAAWLQATGGLPAGVATAAALSPTRIRALSLGRTHWLSPVELEALGAHRQIVAVWRDPLARFLSACRSLRPLLPPGPLEDLVEELAAGRWQPPPGAEAFLPQTRFLGGDPALVHALVPHGQRHALAAHWCATGGTPWPPPGCQGMEAAEGGEGPGEDELPPPAAAPALGSAVLGSAAVDRLRTHYAADSSFALLWSHVHESATST